MIPVLGAAMVGSLFSSDAWNNVTFAAAEVQNPSRNLPLALGLGTRHGEPALHPGQRRLPQHPALRRRSATAPTRWPAGIQHAAQDRVGTAAIEVALGRRRGHRHGGRDPALHLRLQQRADPLRARGSTTPWRATGCSSSGPAAAPGLPDPGLRAGGPGGLGLGALYQRHVRAAAGLRDLRGAASSTSSPRRALPAAADPAGPPPAGQGVRLPGAAGALHARGRRR